METNTKLSRVMFCPKCYANKLPQKGMLFVTIGRGKQKITVRQVDCNGTRGYTPHVIEKNHSIAGNITFTAFCGIDGCGCKLEFDEEKGKYFMEVIETTEHHIPVKQWNALVLYTNDNDYFLG